MQLTPDQQALCHRFFETFGRNNADANGSSDAAQPNWLKFAQEIEDQFRPADTNPIDYILNTPPKKQVIKDHRLEWIDVPASQSSPVKDLMIYICRIRNNLFHGGKFVECWPEPMRDEQLVRHALTILDYARSLHPQVEDAYLT